MQKQSSKHKLELQTADATGVRKHRKAICKALPGGLTWFAKARFIVRAQRAIENYLAFLPIGTPQRRAHRPAAQQQHRSHAHRPSDPLRHGLIGDLYEAYMTTRGDDPDKRGFKKAADKALKAAGLCAVTEHEQTHIREQIKRFTAHAQ